MESFVQQYETGYASYVRLKKKEEKFSKQIQKLESVITQLGVEYSAFNTEDENAVGQAISQYKERKLTEIEETLGTEIAKLKLELRELKETEAKIKQQEKDAYSVCREKLRAIRGMEPQVLADIEKLSQSFSKKRLLKKIQKYDQKKLDVKHIMEQPIKPVRDLFPGKAAGAVRNLLRIVFWPPIKRNGKRMYLLNIILLLAEFFLAYFFIPKLSVALLLIIGILYIVRKVYLYQQYLERLPVYSAVFYFDELVEQIKEGYTDEEAAEKLRNLQIDRGMRETRLLKLVEEREQRIRELEQMDYLNIRRETLEHLRRMYEEKGNVLEETKRELNKCREELKKSEEKERELTAKMEGMEELFSRPMTDKEHNQGLLAPTFFVNFTDAEYIGGPKILNALNHNYKPSLILYDQEVKRNNLEEFHRRAATLITKMITGILTENHYSLVRLTLVDYETGGALFPAQQTSGILSICKNSGDMTKLIASLEQSRDTVHRQGDGTISGVNPQRIQNRNQPLPYHIVFFYGYEESSFGRDFMQLYQTGSLYGFIPIIFLSLQEYQKFVEAGEKKNTVLAEMIAQINEEHCYWYEFGQSEFQKYNKTKNLF